MGTDKQCFSLQLINLVQGHIRERTYEFALYGGAMEDFKERGEPLS